MSLLRGAFVVLTAFALASASAQQPPTPSVPEPGSELTITLVTFGLGEEVFERFGHNALWVHDASTGEDVAYHWGQFSFAEPHFLARFLTGDNHYWMAPNDARALIEAYRRIGRPATLQKLNLTPIQALKLRDFMRWNSLPENKFYRYDYFRDNCSTRLRDALDAAIGGAIKRQTDTSQTALTYRGESIRLTDGARPAQLGIDIALGRPADAALSEWDTYFIPMRLRDGIRRVQVSGPDGTLVPLVAEERHLTSPPGVPTIDELPVAPSIILRSLILGIALAVLVVVLRIMMVSRRSAAWGLALFGSAWSLVCGMLGVILLLAWLATKHVFWVSNENVLLLTPLSLPLVVLIPAALLRGRKQRAARMVAALVVMMSVVALLLAAVPGGQASGAVVAVFLPVHFALAWALALPARAGKA